MQNYLLMTLGVRKEKIISELQKENQELKARQPEIICLQSEIDMLLAENARLKSERDLKESENVQLRKRSRVCVGETRIARRKAEHEMALRRAKMQEDEELLIQCRLEIEAAQEEINILHAKIENRDRGIRRLEEELVQLRQNCCLKQMEDRERFLDLHQRYDLFREQHARCEETIQQAQQKIKELTMEYNGAIGRIGDMTMEGMGLLDTLDSASRTMHNLIYPGVPDYVAEELKAIRAALAPYVAIIRRYNKGEARTSQ